MWRRWCAYVYLSINCLANLVNFSVEVGAAGFSMLDDNSCVESDGNAVQRVRSVAPFWTRASVSVFHGPHYPRAPFADDTKSALKQHPMRDVVYLMLAQPGLLVVLLGLEELELSRDERQYHHATRRAGGGEESGSGSTLRFSCVPSDAGRTSPASS